MAVDLDYLALGSSWITRPTSVLSTSEEPPERSWRLVLRGLWPRLWRRPAEPDLNPFAVLRKRLAAARLVFNLGIHQLLVLYEPYIAPITKHPRFRVRARYGRIRNLF